MEELNNKINILINETNNKNLKVALLLYKKSIIKIIDYYNDSNDFLKNRIINDNIFTELVFDKINDLINTNQIDKAIFLLKKEAIRFRIMLFYFDRGLYDNNIITQDGALDTLVEYHKGYLKKNGTKLYKKYDYKDLKLTDMDISRISFMVVHPTLIDNNEKVK